VGTRYPNDGLGKIFIPEPNGTQHGTIRRSLHALGNCFTSEILRHFAFLVAILTVQAVILSDLGLFVEAKHFRNSLGISPLNSRQNTLPLLIIPITISETTLLITIGRATLRMNIFELMQHSANKFKSLLSFINLFIEADKERIKAYTAINHE
jgi:hypothetical protein